MLAGFVYAAHLRRATLLALAALFAFGIMSMDNAPTAATLDEKRAAERAALRKWTQYYYEKKQREKKEAQKREERKAEIRRLERKQLEKKERERLEYLKLEQKKADQKRAEKKAYEKREREKYEARRAQYRYEQARRSARNAEWKGYKQKATICKIIYGKNRSPEKVCGVY